MAISAATRSTPAAIPSAKSPVFYSWGTLPFTTQAAQQTSALRVTRSSGTATVVVTSTTLTVNDGSDHAFTLASYSTVTALAAAITALGNGWTATVLNTLGRLPASQLVTRSLVSCSAANIDLLMQGTADGDALLIHPNHRIMAKIGCQSATIDYFMPPGATAYGYHHDGPDNSQIVARFADFQEWQGLTKSSSDVDDPANYDNGISFNGLARRPDYDCVILGSEEDVLGADDQAAMDAIYGPYLRYSPFAANCITSLITRFAGIAAALRVECDSRGVCYPSFIAEDIENNYGFVGGCGLWEWLPETANIADGGPNYLDNGRGRGSLLHGKLAFNLYVTGSSGADPGSFTTFTASADTRTVYVSSSGDDSNSGLTSGSPKKTIAAGVALLRNGYPDWLLLKCGDQWINEPISTNWLLSGRSSSEKMLISTYGSGARPLLLLTDRSGFRRQGGGAAPTTISHVAIVGIEFREYLKSPADTSTMISIIKQVNDFLIEDVVTNGGGEGLLVQGESNTVRHQDVVVNRSIFVNANSTAADPRTQGMYAAYTNGLVITDCVFDNNAYPTSDIFCHNIYIDANCGPTIIERNYIMRPCANGIQARSGGTMRWNIFVDCAIAALSSNGNGQVTGQGVNTVDYNVIVSGQDISASSLRGNGLDLQSFVSGSCRYNIIGQKVSTNTNTGSAISLSNSAAGFPFQNTEIAYNIIRNWYAGILVDENNATWTYSGVTIHDNDIEERRGTSGTYIHWRLRFNTWTGITYSNNLYHHATTNTPFLFGGTNKTHTQWVTASGETGSNFTNAASSATLVPLIHTAINAIKSTSLASTADVGAYLLARGRGTWDSTINGKAVFDWYNAQVGGSAPTGGINTNATIAITPFKYVAGSATNGSVSLNGTPVITLTESTTIGAVVDAINGVSGFAATIAAESSPSDLFRGTNVPTFTIGAYADSANPYYFWTLTWPQKYYRGWLQYLIDEPTLADIARRANETIYQDLVAGVWTNRTFDWWWVNVVQAEGIDNFPRTTSTDQATLYAGFSGNRLDYAVGQDQNQKQRIVITNAASGTFTLTFGGQTTSNIALSASASTLQDALVALSSIGSGQVSVSKPHGEYWLVEMTGTFAQTTKALFTANASHLVTLSGTPTITITEAVRAVTRGTNWLSAAVDTGLTPNVGRTQYDFSSGVGSTTLLKANALFHAIHTLYAKCLAYRLARGILDPMQDEMPGIQFANDYGSAFGLRPRFFPSGGTSNVNFGNECGALPCGAVAPTCYRPYILDDYSQDAGKFWRPASTASTLQAGYLWTDEIIASQQAAAAGQPVCPWLAEPGQILSNTGATWVHTDYFLKGQLHRFINAGRLTPLCTFHHFYLYLDSSNLSEGAVNARYRGSTLSTVDTSDRMILGIINDAVSFAGVGPNRRKR